MAKVTAHSNCGHESTPAARAACRRAGGPRYTPNPSDDAIARETKRNVEDFLARKAAEDAVKVESVTAVTFENCEGFIGQKVAWETINFQNEQETRVGYLVSWSPRCVTYRERPNAQLMRFIPFDHVQSARLV